jgi:hypothetical protein
MELPNNKALDNNTEQCRTFDVIVSPRGGGDEPKFRVGWAFLDVDDSIYIQLNPFTVLQDSSDGRIYLKRKEMSLPRD